VVHADDDNGMRIDCFFYFIHRVAIIGIAANFTGK
jgi:hypothetical protein